FPFSCAPTARTFALSLHDALPISDVGDLLAHQRDLRLNRVAVARVHELAEPGKRVVGVGTQNLCPRAVLVELAHLDVVLLDRLGDRKSTRLNSSHVSISYAVFCLK